MSMDYPSNPELQRQVLWAIQEQLARIADALERANELSKPAEITWDQDFGLEPQPYWPQPYVVTC